MDYSTAFLVAFIIGLLLLHYLSTRIPKLADGSYTECSLYHLKNGYYWCLFTATCFHADLGHCLYNLVYYAMIAFELLSAVNFSLALTLAIFFGSGLVAWIASILVNRLKYGEMSDYIWSLGASPATYGSAMFLVIIQPKMIVAGGETMKILNWNKNK